MCSSDLILQRCCCRSIPAGNLLESSGNSTSEVYDPASNDETNSLSLTAQGTGMYELRVYAYDGTPVGSFDISTSGAIDADRDSDGDGLHDVAEYYHGSDPVKQDTDGDGIADYAELAAGTSPRIASEYTSAVSTTWGTVTPKQMASSEFDKPFRVEYPGAATYYQFNLTANQGVTIALTGHINSGSLQMALYDPAGVLLSYGSNSTSEVYDPTSDGETNLISFKAKSSGIYKLKVYSYSGTPQGSYDLAFYNAWYNPGVTDSQRSFYSSSTTGRYIANGSYSIPDASNKDTWFRFSAQAGAAFAINLTPHINSGSMQMALYDPTENLLKYSGNNNSEE